MSLQILVAGQSPGGQSCWKSWAAGFEDYRTLLWGSPQLKELGLQLLPQIATNLVVPASQFSQLLEEIDVLLDASRTRRDNRFWMEYSDHIQDYHRNFHEAVEYAQAHNVPELSVE